MKKSSTGKIKVQDGTRLFYRYWKGAANKPILLFVHGMAEHSGRYAFPVEYFLPQGYTIYSYDQRGHGHSDGRRGHVERLARFIGDLHHVLLWIRKREGKKKIFLIGHSFGGQLVLNYGIRHGGELAGIIVSSPNVRLKMRVPCFKKLAGLFIARYLPFLTVDAAIDSKHLTHDKSVVKAHDEDPLVIERISVRFASEIFANQDRLLDLAPDFKQASLFLHGGGDLICDPQGTADFYKACSSEDKTLKVYPGFYHEIFNERGKEKVFKTMDAWLKERE
jgi:acylglycerol lipase